MIDGSVRHVDVYMYKDANWSVQSVALGLNCMYASKRTLHHTRVGAPSDKDGKKLKNNGGGIDHMMHPSPLSLHVPVL